MMKRIAKYIFIVFLLMIVLVFGYVVIGGAICNDIKAWRIEKSLGRQALPAETEFMKSKSFVGNTSGTGNHTEIWAGILIRSALSEDELSEYYKNFDVSMVTENMKKFAPACGESLFDDAFHFGDVPGQRYFVISNYYEAFTQIDLRGH